MSTLLRVHRRGREGQNAFIKEFTLDEDGTKILEIETRICASCKEGFVAGDRQLYCRDKCRFDFNNLAKKMRG
jgi:hypothetical protein